MSRRTRTVRNMKEDDGDEEITSGDEAEREYERHADEPIDSDEVITEKVATLVELMKTCNTKMIYTGAGISTAANIPDYRGPGGVYTLAKKGIAVTCHNIVSQSPTTSHLVIKELYRHRYISHIVSQNCDGMHLRSGIPQCALSEIHGNMHIEVCSACPDRQFIRKFDVTEDSGYRAHTTRRVCPCSASLLDTIVHYGERGKARFPLNWEAAQELVPHADLIICIGSSLQVLKDYKFLWPAPGSNAKIVIINLQWTPKDADASLVIRGDCEKILTKLAEGLEIDIKHYCRECDPILTSRRNTRNGELLMKISDCMCHIRPPRCSSSVQNEDEEQYCPGWWREGMRAIYIDADRARRSNTKEDSGYEEQNRDLSSNTPSPPEQAAPKRGRPRKRKSSSDEDATQNGKKKTSGSDDEYEPERHHQQRAPVVSSLRSTRSSGIIVDDHPLVGEFRKKRQDAGRRRGGMDQPVAESLDPVPAYQDDVEGEILEEEVVVEEEDIDVEKLEEEFVEEVEEEDTDEEIENLHEPDLDDVANSSLSETVVLRPRRQHQSEDDEDVYVDVVGDFEDEEDIEYEEVASLMRNESNSPLFNEENYTYRGMGSSSLSLSLSQLNSIPNEPTDVGEQIGERSAFALDDFDYNEELPHDDMLGSQINRYANDGTGPSTSNYFDDNIISHNDGMSYDPSSSALINPDNSTLKLNFAKKNQTALTSATLPIRYQRGPRRKKAPDQNSVEFFLRQINGSRPTETATSIGAIYEQAKQIVNPEENEQQFQTTLISAVRDRLGVQPRYDPPEIKTAKKASYKSRKGVAASLVDEAVTDAV